MRRDVATDGVAVSMYMSKPADDRVQLVLTDNGQGTGNGKEASQVTQQIYTDITRGNYFYILYNDVLHC